MRAETTGTYELRRPALAAQIESNYAAPPSLGVEDECRERKPRYFKLK